MTLQMGLVKVVHVQRKWPKMGPKGAKRSQVEAKLAGSCGQEVPRTIQERLLGAMLGASWPIWEPFLEHLAEKAAKQKT